MNAKSIIKKVPCTVMRGGTSKGVFFYAEDIPAPGAQRDRFLCAVMGSPDERQIDGLGGSDPLTSKAAVIRRLEDGPAQIEYTFAQVSVGQAAVDYKANCGNITSAVGLFAVQEGLVPVAEPVTEVRIWNTNTEKVLKVYVPCANGAAAETGDFRIDGVPGTGARIEIDFSETAGAASGKLLPTGNPVDVLQVPGLGALECSIVDIANPLGFVRAADLGLGGRETPAELAGQPVTLQLLETVRSLVAEKIGLVQDWRDATAQSPAVPLLALVSAPGPGEEGLDLISRVMFMQAMHKTYSATAAVCTGTAAAIAGTIPHQLARRDRHPFGIGHPAGRIDVDVELTGRDGSIRVHKAAFGRTARRLMEGTAYVPVEEAD